MKLINYLSATVAILLMVSAAPAQTNPFNTASQPKRSGKVVVPNRPTATDSANVSASNLRPPRVERPNLPPEVRARIERFKLDANTYLAQQQALKKQFQGANDRERAAIREQMKELQQQWVERSKEMRKEYKERQAELREKLSEYRELLDNVRGNTLLDTGGRPRRGED
jgi:hypothetical protein